MGSLLMLMLVGLQGVSTVEQSPEYVYGPYNEGRMDPQLSGWPLTAEERAYVVERAEHERRPGRESMKHLPRLWPVVPSAGHWGGTSWLEAHEKLVRHVREQAGPCDVLLVGDSITQQWGSPLDKGQLNASWRKVFGDLRVVNIGIGGDKTQNILWRLDHGGVEGLQPKVIVLMIGNNNMFFTPETGVESAAAGVQACVKNLRRKFPDAVLLVSEILPAGAPGQKFYEDIQATNAALRGLALESEDRQLRLLPLWSEFVQEGGKLKGELYLSDRIHLSLAGYDLYAARLQPFVVAAVQGQSLPRTAAVGPVGRPAKIAGQAVSGGMPAVRPALPAADVVLAMQPVLEYPYAAYNAGRLDPQLTGWPLTEDEWLWVQRGEYFRKPGHEVQKHLPEMWFVTPTAAHWAPKDGSEGNDWIVHHGECLKRMRSERGAAEIVLLGDSLTQGWGGGWDGAAWNAAWERHFEGRRAVNLGIGGDRIEQILWRLDHGALDGVTAGVIVLMIGVNNAPLVQANGVPVSAAAEGIALCVKNIRRRCPESKLLLVQILPAFDRAKETGARIAEMNHAVAALKLDADVSVRVLNLDSQFLNADGSLCRELYSDGHLHLNAVGYDRLGAGIRQSIQDWLR